MQTTISPRNLTILDVNKMNENIGQDNGQLTLDAITRRSSRTPITAHLKPR